MQTKTMNGGSLSWALRWVGILTVCVVVVSLAACGASPSSQRPTPSPTITPPPGTPSPALKTITLTSSAFHAGGYIPSLYTCDGAGISPPLAWSGVPGRTATFVLLMEDESGTGFTHWVLFNLPSGTHDLPAHIPNGRLANGARQGVNDTGRIGYIGPCPTRPVGATDDYRFTLYALDVALKLDVGVTIQQVQDAASGHILAYGQLDGFYQRTTST